MSVYYLVTLTLNGRPIILLAFHGAVGPLATLATGLRPCVLRQAERTMTDGWSFRIIRTFSGEIFSTHFGFGHVEVLEVTKNQLRKENNDNNLMNCK